MRTGDPISRVKLPRHEPDHSHLMLNLRITGAILPLLHMRLWRIQEQMYLYVYLLCETCSHFED
jgi:hypothetical protein